MPYYKISKKSSGPKATAWKWFSMYIRLRDAIATTGSPDSCRCITCKNVFPIMYIQAGHMLGGRTGGILFDETMVYGQCKSCNCDHGGEYQAFKMIMVERNGIEWYELKEQARHSNSKMGDFECKLIAEEYRKKYKELLGRIQ
jgi:hypothetical protein